MEGVFMMCGKHQGINWNIFFITNLFEDTNVNIISYKTIQT
jgi:hypothetical protein